MLQIELLPTYFNRSIRLTSIDRLVIIKLLISFGVRNCYSNAYIQDSHANFLFHSMANVSVEFVFTVSDTKCLREFSMLIMRTYT